MACYDAQFQYQLVHAVHLQTFTDVQELVDETMKQSTVSVQGWVGV